MRLINTPFVRPICSISVSADKKIILWDSAGFALLSPYKIWKKVSQQNFFRPTALWKKVRGFPVPSRNVTYQTLPGRQ
jgi:hypothetical protein